MSTVEEKIKFAVFIDYDNIEIGVKSTLNREFDVRCVLEGLKERGEVVTTIAYGNWGRHGSAARTFSEHGVQMVQRDSTPRGDKNGGDINLALDALEMAFTREHINAFAILSGDSDFMSLVNKLKQYNKRVYIVGGKAFTSTILQRNCHEFISYESLLDTPTARTRRGGSAPSSRGRKQHVLPLQRALPLLDRAMRALEMRSVQPQLGLLKSTMLQLDSAFTERDYGTSSFSTFIQNLAKEGYLTVHTIDGHAVVERAGEEEPSENGGTRGPEDAIPLLREVLARNADILKIGLPAREVEALVTAADPDFNESDYGFSEFAELLNFAQDKGMVRVEADAARGLRYYPGDDLLSGGDSDKPAEKAATDGKSDEPKAAPRRRTRTGRRRRTTTKAAETETSSDDAQAPSTADADDSAAGGDAAQAKPKAAPRRRRTRAGARTRTRSKAAKPETSSGSSESSEGEAASAPAAEPVPEAPVEQADLPETVDSAPAED